MNDLRYRERLFTHLRSLHKFAAIAILLLILQSLRPPPYTYAAVDTPYWQPVVEFLQTGDYASAYDQIQTLLESRPGDALLLRFKGVCLMETGYNEAAVTVLYDALEAAPNSVATKYYLSQALAYRGSVLESIRLIDEIIEMAPDSQYAQLASSVLPELEALTVTITAVPDVRRWNLYARVGTEYDDNVPVRSNDSDETTTQDSWKFIYSFYGEVRFPDQKIDSKPFTLGLGYSLSGTEYEEDLYKGYDLFSQALSLFLSHDGTWLERFYNIRLETRFNTTKLGWDDYSDVGSLDLSFSYYWHEQITTTFISSWSNKSYEDDTEYPEYYSRDGNEYDFGLRNYFYLMQNKLVLGLHYLYRNEDAEGYQSELRSNDLTGSIAYSLPYDVRLTGSIIYQQEDYPEYRPVGRLDNVWTFNSGLEYTWKDIWTAELYYQYATADSDQDLGDYQRNIVGIGLSVSL
jgi:hypothetical protein